MAEKIDRKQLKKPDEFQVVAGKAMEWVAAHQKKVLAGLAALFLLAILAWALATWRSSRENKAGIALSHALELSSRPLASEAQPGQETFPSNEERDKAALAALEKVRSEHAGTTAAQTALAELGFHKLKQADAAGAQKDLQDFLAAAGPDHPLRPFAQESLGYAFEAQNKLDDAKTAFEKLREMGRPGRADLQAARLALVQGKPDAKEQLEKVAKEYAKEMEVARTANERLALASLPPVPKAQPSPAPTPAADPSKPQGKKKK